MSRQRRLDSPQFTSSDAKNFIRDIIDFEIIRAFKDEYYPDQPLAYLGLPGEELLDVLSWRSFIGRWTGVQIADTPGNAAIADRMIRNALLRHMERGFHPVRADIDVLLSTEAGRRRLQWPYEIVNLDYFGGLISASRRLDALRGLFAQQVGIAFAFLLTLNLRDNDRGELTKLVNDEEEELLGLELSGVIECFSAHREYGHAGELKIYVPIFIGTVANRHTLLFSPPILYRGTRPMIHFAVRCIPYTERSAGRVFRTRDHIPFLNLPLYVLNDRDDLREVSLCRIETYRNAADSTVSL